MTVRSPDPLPPEFAEALGRAREQGRLGHLGSSVTFFSTVGSTNDVAAALAVEGREGAVVIADAQTEGRGRRGRQWFSPPGAGLYVSVVLSPTGQRSRGPIPEPLDDRATLLLTLAAGVALAEAVQVATGLAPDIKWPNDLLVGRRKLAGILAEAVAAGGVEDRRRPVVDAREGAAPRAVMKVVLGYGINISPASFPPELGDRATSLESELGRPIDRAALCAEALAALERRYDDLLGGRFDAILDAWRGRAPSHRGARVAWESPAGLQAGVTAGVDDSGALLVRVGDRRERIVAGVLTWL